MDPWYQRLFAVLLVGSWGGYGWLLWASAPLRLGLASLTGIVAAAAVAVAWRRGAEWTERGWMRHVALASWVNLAATSGVVAAERLWSLGVVHALASNGHHFLIGVLGVGGGAVLWWRARPKGAAAPVRPPPSRPPEPAPPASAALDTPPDWDQLAAGLAARGDTAALAQLQTLRRVSAALGPTAPDADSGPRWWAEGQRVVHQEARRLVDASVARAVADDDDVLTQAAELLRWGTQKLPELADLDVSDVLMAKAIADIRALNDGVEHVFVDHRRLRPIHPIDRPTANEKCDQRAAAARAARGLLAANGYRLSEALIAANPELQPFASVTGFQVVELADGGLVTFEGNGRREALQRAFGDEDGIEVEVRLYRFDDPRTRATIRRRVQRVRRWKGVG